MQDKETKNSVNFKDSLKASHTETVLIGLGQICQILLKNVIEHLEFSIKTPEERTCPRGNNPLYSI